MSLSPHSCNTHNNQDQFYCPGCLSHFAKVHSAASDGEKIFNTIKSFLSPFYYKDATQVSEAHESIQSIYKSINQQLASTFNTIIDQLYNRVIQECELMLSQIANECSTTRITQLLEGTLKMRCKDDSSLHMFNALINRCKYISEQVSLVCNQVFQNGNDFQIYKFNVKQIYSQLIDTIKIVQTNTKSISKHMVQFIMNFTNYKGPPIIHYWGKSDITILNPINESKNTFTMISQMKPNFESISFGERIFIIGGNLSNETKEVTLQNAILIPKTAMSIQKYFHSLCLGSQFIGCIGGYNNRALGGCELYYPNSDKWISLPWLNSSRFLCASFCYNYKYIYTFGGKIANERRTNTMERINLLKPIKWDIAEMQKKLTPRTSCHAMQIKNNQIILFGGYSSEYLKECYSLDLSKEVIGLSRICDLSIAACFYISSAPIIVSNNIYGVDENRNIHVYAKAQWKVINAK